MVSQAEGETGAHDASKGSQDRVWPSLHPLIAIALFCALYLQRFGLQAPGGAFVSAGHVIVLLSCFALLMRRRVAIDLISLVLLSGFVAYALLVSVAAATWPLKATEIAPQSLFLLATLYAVLCFAPVRLDDTRDVLFVYNGHMLLFGILGIAQFALQFVGIRFFSFRGLVPEPLLIEHAYNVVIPLNYGSPYFKSNGVFFLEPSLFSQFSALALAIELVLFRRLAFVAVFAGAILVSYSGSGVLTLAAALTILSVMRPRYALLLLALLAAGAVALTVLSQIAPEVHAYYVRRALEFQDDGTSGYLRYVTPYLFLGEVWNGSKLFFGYGPGTAEKFQIGFDYNVNAFVKIAVEYGLIGAAVFFGFLFSATGRRGAGSFLMVLCFSWYFLGGGYHLTSCVVHVMAAFLVWSSWSPSNQATEVRL
jgi:hypothetical protein